MRSFILKASARRLHVGPVAGLALCLLIIGCASTHPNGRTSSSRTSLVQPQVTGQLPDGGPLRSALRHYYSQWKGTPYRYGGTTRNGIDCSAFVQQAMASTTDLDLPRTTLAQIHVGKPVSRNRLRVGDLVFFRTGGGYRHVGIYMGHGRFMHASTSIGVTISRLDNVYWHQHYWQARRPEIN